MKKIITEEIHRIKEIMYEKSFINESFIGVLSRNAVTNAVRASITTVMDDFVKNALKIGTKTAIGDARYVVDDILKGGAQGAMKVAATANKVYDDVAKAAFGKSYASLDDNTKLMLRNQVRTTLDDANDDILKAAKNASDDLDNLGKPKPVDGGGGGGGGGGGNIRPTLPWYKPTWNWATKTRWGRILLGAATLTAAYLAWRKIWGGDDDLPLCLKGLIKNEEDFNRFLENRYISSGLYRFYAEDNKVLMMFPGGGSQEGEWEYDEDNKIIEIDFGGNQKTSIPCDYVLPSPDECPPGYTKNPSTGECEKSGDGGGGGGGGGGGSYKNCTDFPFIKYCKNPKIAEVQGCLGGLVADGKLGPKTEAALEKAGYGIDISEEDYNKIMEKCKGVQPSPEKEPGLDTTSDMSNKPE